MDVSVGTRDDLRKIQTYDSKLQAVRRTVANGVYPTCRKAVQTLDDLNTWIKNNPSFSDTHKKILNGADVHIDALKSALEAIVIAIENLERGIPGTLQLPKYDD